MTETASAESVERLTVHRLAMPLDSPIRSGIHSIDGIHTVVIEAAAAGEVGVGYAFAFSANEALAIAAFAEDLAGVVTSGSARGRLHRDREPGDHVGLPAVAGVREHWRAMREHLDFFGHEGASVMALAAVDTALWDLHARRLGVPLYRLLGAGARATEAYAAGGWLSWSVEQVIEEARAFAQAGYRAYKMRVGSPDWRTDVERVCAVREALGADFGLMVDVNQAWSYDTALRAGSALDELGLLWIEEPVDAQDLGAQAELGRRLLTPIAAGEMVWGLRGFERLLKAGGVGVVQLDLMRCGGITPFLAVLSLVDAAGVPVTSHLFTPISAHLLTAASNAYMVEHLPSWFDPLFEEEPVVTAGCLQPSDAPGLGLTLSRAALERWELHR